MSDEKLLDVSLRKLKFIFTCNGILLLGDRNASTNLKYRIMYIINFCIFAFSIPASCYWFLDPTIQKSFYQQTYFASCITIAFNSFLKSVILNANTKNMWDLINTLRHLESKFCEKVIVSDIVRGRIKFLHTIIKIRNVIQFCGLSIFYVVPLFITIVTYLRFNDTELFLAVLTVYPVDTHDPRHWIWIWIHQLWISSTVLLNLCGADYLLYVFCTHIGIQFENLIDALKTVVEDTESADEIMVHNMYAELVLWHQELIRLTEVFEAMYTKSTIFNFLLSSIQICFTGFNILVVDNDILRLMFVIFQTINFSQIFFFCYFGEQLMVLSTQVSDAVYESKWYNAKQAVTKNILFLILMRSQKPCKLTAFGFANVNLNSFARILGSSWSYFSLLWTMYKYQHN